MRSPIKWYGGKYFLKDWLISHMCPHHTYVEVFGGGAQLLFGKCKSAVDVYNDIDSRLANFFRVLQDEELFQALYRKCQVSPYSRELFNEYKQSDTSDLSPVDKAHRFFVTCRQSFGGVVSSGWSTHKQCTSRATVWLNVIHMLPEISQRLMGTLIENMDWRECLDLYEADYSFFYLDPPYVPTTRTAPAVYEHEMTERDHEDLASRISDSPAKIMLSGYDNPIYNALGWEKVETPAKYNGHNPNVVNYDKRECLWMNYDSPQLELF